MEEQQQKTELGEAERESIKKAFSLFDKNGDQTISVCEMGTVIRASGFNATEDDVKSLMKIMDKDEDGKVSIEEFLSLLSNFKFTDEKDLVESFKLFDKDGNGFIDAEELQEVLTSLGEGLSEAELEEFMKEVDIDNDGMIDYQGMAPIEWQSALKTKRRWKEMGPS